MVSEQIVRVPDIGDAAEAEIIEVCVAPGDQVVEDDSLIVIESDKASMEIPSPTGGVVGPLSVEVGSKVSEGDAILILHTDSEEDVAPVEEAPLVAEEVTRQPEPVSTVEVGSVVAAGIEVRVPDIGGDENVEVIEVNVAVGDQVELDDTLIVLESDKASMEVPCPQAGKVAAMNLSLGDRVSEGGLILTLESADGSAPTVAPVAPSPAKSAPAPKPESVPSAGANEQILTIPDLGDADAVEVIEITVKVGDSITVDDTLAVLESDKASLEVPSEHEGMVKAVLLEVGQKVSQGTPVAVLELAGSQAANAVPSSAQPQVAAEPAKPAATPKPPAATAPAAKSGELVYAGPAVRMLARELGVDLEKVTASGPRGRILKEDVQNFVKAALKEGVSAAAPAQGSVIPPIPTVDFSKFGKVETQPMSRIQKLTAEAMQRNWLNIPHVTQFDEADITDLEEFRAMKKDMAQERGVKLTPLPFLLKACAAALKKYPQFNVSLGPSGADLIQKHYCHIGMAMNTPAGLMVPVIRDVDKKGIWELTDEVTELGVKGQEGKLTREDLQGGCFTVSSLGAIGGTGFTPIVNAPEVAILGVSKSVMKPVYINSEFVPRSMLPMALSYDHRAINGVDGGLFMTFLTQVLADIRKLVM